jgi:Na+/H+ antiporter NhaC
MMMSRFQVKRRVANTEKSVFVCSKRPSQRNNGTPVMVLVLVLVLVLSMTQRPPEEQSVFSNLDDVAHCTLHTCAYDRAGRNKNQ